MECNICYKDCKKLIKCSKCSFMCCMNCISKLNNLELCYDKVCYDCCVCKENNFIRITDIKDIKIMKVIYMECTLQMIAKKDPSLPPKLEGMGTIEYVGDVPYLVIKIKEETLVGTEN